MIGEKKYQDAKMKLKESLKIFRKIDNPSELGKKVAFLGHKNMALIYVEMKKLDKAIKEYLESTKLNDNDLSVWLSIYNLSMGFVESEDALCCPKLAIHSLESILKLNPTNEFSLIKLLETLYIVGDEITCSNFLPSVLEVVKDQKRIRAIQVLIDNGKNNNNFYNFEDEMDIISAEEVVGDLLQIRKKLVEKQKSSKEEDPGDIEQTLKDCSWNALGNLLLNIYESESEKDEVNYTKIVKITPKVRKNKRSSSSSEESASNSPNESNKDKEGEKKQEGEEEDSKDDSQNKEITKQSEKMDLSEENKENSEEVKKSKLKEVAKRYRNEEAFNEWRNRKKENKIRKKTETRDFDCEEQVKVWLKENEENKNVLQLMNSFVYSVFHSEGDFWNKETKKVTERIMTILREIKIHQHSILDNLYFAEFYFEIYKSKILEDKEQVFEIIDNYLFVFYSYFAPSLLPYQICDPENLDKVATYNILSKEHVVRFFWLKYNFSNFKNDSNANLFLSICKNILGETEIKIPYRQFFSYFTFIFFSFCLLFFPQFFQSNFSSFFLYMQRQTI